MTKHMHLTCEYGVYLISPLFFVWFEPGGCWVDCVCGSIEGVLRLCNHLPIDTEEQTRATGIG